MYSEPQNRRGYFRVQYALKDRPTLTLAGVPCRVVDCSERGLHLDSLEGVPLLCGESLEGVVKFRRGLEVFVSGVVVRDACGRKGVHLDPPGIPLRVILDEQRWVRSRHV